jgi:hypothetical protein
MPDSDGQWSDDDEWQNAYGTGKDPLFPSLLHRGEFEHPLLLAALAGADALPTTLEDTDRILTGESADEHAHAALALRSALIRIRDGAAWLSPLVALLLAYGVNPPGRFELGPYCVRWVDKVAVEGPILRAFVVHRVESFRTAAQSYLVEGGLPALVASLACDYATMSPLTVLRETELLHGAEFKIV